MSASPVSTATPLVTRLCAGHITTKPCARSNTPALQPLAEHARGADPLRLRPRGDAPGRRVEPPPATPGGSRGTLSAWPPCASSGATRAPGDSCGPGGGNTEGPATRGATSALPTTRAACEGSCTCSLAPARAWVLVGISVSGARYHSSVRHENEPPWWGTCVPRAPGPGRAPEDSPLAEDMPARAKRSIPPVGWSTPRVRASRRRGARARARGRFATRAFASRLSRRGARCSEAPPRARLALDDDLVCDSIPA